MEPEYKAPARLAVEQTQTVSSSATPAESSPAAFHTHSPTHLVVEADDNDTVIPSSQQLDLGLDDHEVDHGAWSDDGDSLFADESASSSEPSATATTQAAAAPATASPSKTTGGRKQRVKKEKVVLTKAKVSFDEDF